MNKHAFAYKQSCFAKFVIGTRTPIYADMPKKKKKAVCALAQYYQLTTMRSLFIRLAVNTSTFKHISHPKSRYLGSVQCLMRNFRKVRERLAFLKLKKNLNLQLRDSMSSYKEQDKELFVQLNQILISSHTQQGGLDGGFSYALSEIFGYLKTMSEQGSFIPNIGYKADDQFVGHIDEAVLSMKSSVYLPNLNVTDNSSLLKLKVYSAQFTQPQPHSKKTVKLSYDQNVDMSQHDQMMS